MGDIDCDCGSCDCDFGSCDCDFGSCDCGSCDCGSCDCGSCDCGPCECGSCDCFPDDGCGLFCCKTCDPDDCLNDACSFLLCCGESDLPDHDDVTDCCSCIKGFLCCICYCLTEPSSSIPVHYSSNNTNIHLTDTSRNVDVKNVDLSKPCIKPVIPGADNPEAENQIVDSQPS